MGVTLRGVKTRTVLGAMVILTAISTASAANAGKRVNPDDLPLSGSSIPAAMLDTAGFWRYYLDASLGGQAIFVFGAPNYNDTRLNRAGERIEKFYNDVLRQQSYDSPIVRTRDLESPYCSSLLGTATACDLAVQPPPVPQPPIIPPAPMLPPPAPVPALY